MKTIRQFNPGNPPKRKNLVLGFPAYNTGRLLCLIANSENNILNDIYFTNPSLSPESLAEPEIVDGKFVEL